MIHILQLVVGVATLLMGGYVSVLGLAAGNGFEVALGLVGLGIGAALILQARRPSDDRADR